MREVICSHAALCSCVEAFTCCAAEAWPSAVRAIDWMPLAALDAASAFAAAALVTPLAATRVSFGGGGDRRQGASSISRETVSISADARGARLHGRELVVTRVVTMAGHLDDRHPPRAATARRACAPRRRRRRSRGRRAGARRFDGRVQREQVRLLGDRAHRLHEPVDVGGRRVERRRTSRVALSTRALHVAQDAERALDLDALRRSRRLDVPAPGCSPRRSAAITPSAASRIACSASSTVRSWRHLRLGAVRDVGHRRSPSGRRRARSARTPTPARARSSRRSPPSRAATATTRDSESPVWFIASARIWNSPGSRAVVRTVRSPSLSERAWRTSSASGWLMERTVTTTPTASRS